MTEKSLPQGKSTQGVVRVGNTVHRPLNPNSKYIHQLLLLLEEKRCPYSPRFLGLDEKGRETLTYIEGDIARGDIQWTDDQLMQITKIIKEFHDVTQRSELAENKEVVCHNDLAPWNLVIKDSKPVAFIDFDDSAPGYRIDDFAYFLWTFLEFGQDIPIEEQRRKIELLNKEYGEFNMKDLIQAILNQQEKILKKRKLLSKTANTLEEREFSKFKIEEINKEIKWTKNFLRNS